MYSNTRTHLRECRPLPVLATINSVNQQIQISVKIYQFNLLQESKSGTQSLSFQYTTRTTYREVLIFSIESILYSTDLESIEVELIFYIKNKLN